MIDYYGTLESFPHFATQLFNCADVGVQTDEQTDRHNTFFFPSSFNNILCGLDSPAHVIIN